MQASFRRYHKRYIIEAFNLSLSRPDLLAFFSYSSCRIFIVVIDYREDKNASTGEFELAYKQRMSSCQPYLGAALSLQGTRITTGKKSTSVHNEDSKVSLVSKSPMVGSKKI